MLEDLHIRNYRVFNDLTVEHLSRINLIAGKNNSGKTSLLEAIYLLSGAGNPQLVLNIMAFRGIDSVTGNPQTIRETFWKPLFSALDMDSTVTITGHHTSAGRLALTIESGKPSTTERERRHLLRLLLRGKLTIESGKPSTTELPLTDTVGTHMANLSEVCQLMSSFESKATGEVKSHMHVTGQAVQLATPDMELPFPGRFIFSRGGNLSEDARLLGRLRQQKQGDVLLEALRVIEPRLQSVEDSSASGTPLIWGDIGLSELIPLPVMGEGMTRIARLILAIASTPGGVVLVDEIENGLHHSVLPKVWKVVDTAARQFNTQIFATTHSFECAETARPFLCSGKFRLHRLEVSGTENRCVTYEPEAIAAALQHNLEIR